VPEIYMRQPAPTAPAPKQPTPKLTLAPGYVAEYRLTPDGQVVNDYSGNNNHGQLGSSLGVDNKDPAWLPHGVDFKGTGYVKLPYCINAERDFTVYIVANVGASAPADVEAYFSMGSSSATTQFARLYRVSDGYLHFFMFNNAGASSGSSLPAANIVSGIRVIKISRVSNILEIRDIKSNVIGARNAAPASPVTLNQMSLGARLRTSADAFLNQSIYYALFYQRATSDAEDQQNYRYIKWYLASKGVALA
jgi:hypothetical protein